MKGKNGSNPQRNTTSKYEVLVNGELSDSFTKLGLAKQFVKSLPSLTEGAEVKIVRRTTTEVFQVMDTFTAQAATQLVTAETLDA